MKKILLMSCLVFPFLISSFCKAEYQDSARVLGYSGIAFAGTLLIHESGHYVALKYLFPQDVNNVRMHLNTWPARVSYYDHGLSTGEENFIHLSGFMFTRSTAEIIDAFNFNSKFSSIAYLFTRFDMPCYVLRSALKQFVNYPHLGGDVHNVVKSWAHNENEQILIYTSLLTIMIIDIYLDRKEIKKHLSRIFF